ncbi:MAG: universal stress protein [Jatrophihabitantaceae bacterium]
MTQAEEILVGVDGSPPGRAAIAWALVEARRRACGVLLVHASDVGPGLWTTTPSVRRGLRELAQPIVDHAVAYARGLEPSVQVRGRLILGSPRRALVAASADCVMTVVGRQGKGFLAAHLVGSLSQSLMAHSHNPVIAVAPDADSAMRQPIQRVVVALGDRPTSMRALDFGIAEAQLHRVRLWVVHAWQVPGWPHSQGAGEDPESAVPGVRIAAETQRISAMLAATAPRHDGVDVCPVVLAGRPVQVISEFCRPSDLLVLGQHRHGRYLPPTLGPVVSGALHHAQCAVAVVGETVLARDLQAETAAARARSEQPLTSGLIAY